MNDEVLANLVDRALADPDFRRRALDDLDGTLAAEGYQLQPDELQAVREFHTQAAGKTDAELEALLADGAQRRQDA